MCREIFPRDIHAQSSPPLPVSVNSVGKEVSRSNYSTTLFQLLFLAIVAALDTTLQTVNSSLLFCNNCGKLGHLAKVCHSKPNGQQGSKNGTLRGKRKASASSAQFPKNERAPSEGGSQVQVHGLQKRQAFLCYTVLVNAWQRRIQVLGGGGGGGGTDGGCGWGWGRLLARYEKPGGGGGGAVGFWPDTKGGGSMIAYRGARDIIVQFMRTVYQ